MACLNLSRPELGPWTRPDQSQYANPKSRNSNLLNSPVGWSKFKLLRVLIRFLTWPKDIFSIRQKWNWSKYYYDPYNDERIQTCQQKRFVKYFHHLRAWRHHKLNFSPILMTTTRYYSINCAQGFMDLKRSVWLAAVMLVTTWYGDRFKMLVTESFLATLSLFWWFFSELNRSPTSQSCHQHITSPTSM